MPFFKGAIIIKKLWNIIYIFSENREKWIEVLSIWIFALYHRYWDRIQEGISVIIASFFFQYKIISRYKDGENFLLFLKSKFEWNLNDLPKDFSIK